MKHYIIPVFVSHLGCPHTCVFCNQSRITMIDRENAEEINVEKVLKIAEEHLKSIDRENSIIELSFFGGTFTAIPRILQKNLLTAAKSLKDAGRIDYIRCSTRPDYIDDEILTLNKSLGMDIIELGVQSLDEEVLRLSGRGHGIKEVKKASELIKKYGMTLGHQLMPGLPGADSEKDIESAKISISMLPDMVRIYPTLIVKDTPLLDMYEKGEYKPYTLEEAVDVSMKILNLYEEAGIKVIRCGLQATEEISPGKSLVDGPYHPAFFELVKGKRANERIKDVYIEGIKEEKGNLEIRVNPKDISLIYAGSKKYFAELSEAVKAEIKVIQDDSLNRGEAMVIKGNGQGKKICI